VLAAVLSLCGVAAYVFWFSPGWELLVVYGVVALIATLSVPAFYRLSGQTLADEMEWLERREAAEHDEMSTRLDSLGRELDGLDITEGGRQARELGNLLDDYHSVVETRFLGSNSGPLEYLTTARRVQKLAVQNLTDMVATGHSLASIARADGVAEPDDGAASGGIVSERGVGNVDGLPGDSGDGRSARRTALADEQRARLAGLLDENRQLFDALSDTAVEVANIASFSRYERLDTLARLTSLAEISSRRGGS